jgi:Lar family restriction alleviation protein
MNQSGLDPCPFCGSNEVEPYWVDPSDDPDDAFANLWGTSCSACEAEGPRAGTELDAIAAWNRRPGQLSVIADLTERCRTMKTDYPGRLRFEDGTEIGGPVRCGFTEMSSPGFGESDRSIHGWFAIDEVDPAWKLATPKNLPHLLMDGLGDVKLLVIKPSPTPPYGLVWFKGTISLSPEGLLAIS